MIKGSVAETNTFYGITELEDISRFLTEVFNFDTDRVKKIKNENFKHEVDNPWDKEKDDDNFISEGKEIKSDEQLNQLIEQRFNVDFNVVNSMPYSSWKVVEYVSSKIFGEIKNSF